MKKILFTALAALLLSCSGHDTKLPDGAYNVKLGETYSESELIAALNNTTFRKFRVFHKGDTFLPGHYDTFYLSEKENSTAYLGTRSSGSAEFSFLECSWISFRIETTKEGMITHMLFGKGTTFPTYPVTSLKADHERLLSDLTKRFGPPEEHNEDSKQIHKWKDSTKEMALEFTEWKDYKNEENASMSCEISLIETDN